MRVHIKHISTRNSAFQHLEVIRRNRSKRTKFREVLIEGVLPINLAIESNIDIKSIYFTDYNGLSDWAKDIIRTHPRAEPFSLTASLMKEISEKEDTSEVMILADQSYHEIDRIDGRKFVLLDRPSSPGNFGTIVRTCESFGIDAIIVSGHGIDPYDSKCISASRGTIFSIPIIKVPSNTEIAAFTQARSGDPGFHVYGSSARGELDIRDATPTEGFLLIIGNETTGMAPYFHELADSVLTIPIHGHASSLNIACATSILLYELTRPIRDL